MSIKKIYNRDYPPLFSLRNLRLLGIAIRRVTNNYCVWEYKEGPQEVERVFAYELYYQFKTLLTNDLNTGNLHTGNLRFDGENDKRLKNDVEYCGVEENLLRISDKRFLKDQRNFSPDLVLHLGQNDQSQDNQSLIIEIKTKKISDSKFAKDLLKLNHFIRLLNFQYAVIISVNTDFNKLKKQIGNIFENREGWNERFNRIVIFNYDNRILQVNTLQNILQENIN